MNELTLKVIGCGDAFASGGRNHSCFFLKINRAGVLLDLGGTAFAGLKQHSVDQSQVDYIIISHLHGDHYGGLPYFLLDAGVQKRRKPLTIVGPKSLREKTLALLALLYPGTRVMEKLSIRFVSFEEPMPLSFPDFQLRAMPVIHSKATDPHGIRLEARQKVIAYSGDTEWTPVLLDLSENAEYHEAKEAQGHLMGEIANIRHILDNAIIISDEATEDMKGIVGLGCTVKVRDLEFEEDESEEEISEEEGSEEEETEE